jgi:hypothetical protein
MVIDADPEATARSMARPIPIPAWMRMSGALSCTPTWRAKVPDSGSTIQWTGASGVPMLSRKSISSATMSMVALISSVMSLMVPGPSGSDGRSKLSETSSLPSEKLTLRPGGGAVGS